MSSFSAEAVLEVLKARFGYDAFRPGQEQAVDSVLAGRETVVILPTGGGKSLCYQVPALMLPGLTVVVSPLISLMKDQVDALDARNIPAAFINSSLSMGQVSDRMARARDGTLKLLYVAPERFMAGSTLDRLAQMKISLFAIDEAHCISEWGHDFRPSYMRLAEVHERLGKPALLALTATATPQVREDIVRQLHMTRPTVIVTGFDRRNLRYHVRPCRTDADKDAALVDELRSREGLAVVYASTRKSVERIAAMLTKKRLPAIAYHAGLDDISRREVQEAFMREDVRAIVATNAFGMGIDKANVRLVVHHAMPGTLEAYYQEAGRAGRDGETADCTLLHAYRDRFTHEYFINGAHAEREVVEKVYAALQRVHDSNGVWPSSAQLAHRLGGKITDRQVDAALRLLERMQVWRPGTDAQSRVFVQLLATPARITAELGETRALELGLLRALWRGAGARLHNGLEMDLDGLGPAFGGGIASGLLDSLQAEQFVMWHRVASLPTLTRPGAPLAAFHIDWAALKKRHAGDLEKLETVQRYCYAKRCRRAFVLRYFGDPAVQPECGACDNCMGSAPVRVVPARGKRRESHSFISTDDVLVPVTTTTRKPTRRRRRDTDSS